MGLLFMLNLYNKPLADIKKADVDITITAQNLLDDYKKDEDLANKKYVDNIVQIKGEISKISVENGNSVITLKDLNGESGIMCHLLPEENLNILKLKKGSQIIIKGVCTGNLLDVIMVRCVLVN